MMATIQPVHLHNTGPKVANLQNGLLFLVLHQPGISNHDRKILQRRLAPEVKTETFGDATADLVGMWQYQLKNWPDYEPVLPPELKLKVQKLLTVSMGKGNGDVDEVTAEALNWLLKEFGAL